MLFLPPTHFSAITLSLKVVSSSLNRTCLFLPLGHKFPEAGRTPALFIIARVVGTQHVFNNKDEV